MLDTYKLDRGDVGALLWHLGADCPGAISITPAGSGPGKMPGRFPEDYEELDETRLRQIVLSLQLHRRLPDAVRNPSPVAGVQGKIAVVMHAGRFHLPRPGSRAPTTHILKVSPVSDHDITRHEVTLLNIAEACGIRAAPCEALEFSVDGRHVHSLISSRFDRRIGLSRGIGVITRIHSEDFCQALGLPPSLKYERDSLNPDRRFSAAAVAEIGASASVPTIFQRDFLRHCLFNLLVGNSDNHGKNGSVLHRGGGTTLAPLYDVVPVFTDRTVTHQLALRHGGAVFAEDLTRQNLHLLLMDLGFGRPNLDRVLKQIATLAKRIADHAATMATKGLAGALYAQAKVIEAALDLEFDLPVRDHYDRLSRDVTGGPGGGWGGFS